MSMSSRRRLGVRPSREAAAWSSPPSGQAGTYIHAVGCAHHPEPERLHVAGLIHDVVQLGLTEKDKRQFRGVLLSMLVGESDRESAEDLIAGVSQLDPDARDLRSSFAWAAHPDVDRLAKVRQNSELADWLSILSSLASPSGQHPSVTDV
jgi:hypothetical protein